MMFLNFNVFRLIPGAENAAENEDITEDENDIYDDYLM